MSDAAEFLIAQYLRDPIRREPKNVGLFVIKNGYCAGKFLGDDTISGDKDLRTVKWANDAKTYRKWVRFWREELGRGSDGLLERLQIVNGGSYDVIKGGVVTATGNDSAADICVRMFPALVEPTAGESEADSADGDTSLLDLKREVNAAFESRNLLAGKVHNGVQNPIYVGLPAMGRVRPYKPTYQ